jgi:putative hemolysin
MVRDLRCALLALAMLGGLAACTQPTPVANNSNEVSFRWNKDASTAGQADRVAKDHCASWGKQAVPAEKKADAQSEFERFDCR